MVLKGFKKLTVSTKNGCIRRVSRIQTQMKWQAWTRGSRKLSFISRGPKIIIECKFQARKF